MIASSLRALTTDEPLLGLKPGIYLRRASEAKSTNLMRSSTTLKNIKNSIITMINATALMRVKLPVGRIINIGEKLMFRKLNAKTIANIMLEFIRTLKTLFSTSSLTSIPLINYEN
jgi:hypothetical protein